MRVEPGCTDTFERSSGNKFSESIFFLSLSLPIPSSFLASPPLSLRHTALWSVSMAVRKASLMAVNKFIRFVITPAAGV